MKAKKVNKRRPPRILKELKSGRYYIRDGRNKIYINDFDRIKNKNQVINTIINQLPTQKRRRAKKKGKENVSVKRGENEKFTVFMPQIGQAQFPNKGSLDLFHNTLSELKAKVEKSEKEQKNNNMVTKYLMGLAKNPKSANEKPPESLGVKPETDKPLEVWPNISKEKEEEIKKEILKQQKRLNRANASVKTKEDAKMKLKELKTQIGWEFSNLDESNEEREARHKQENKETLRQMEDEVKKGFLDPETFRLNKEILQIDNENEKKKSSLASIPLELNTPGSKKYMESLISQIKKFDPSVSKKELEGYNENELVNILAGLQKEANDEKLNTPFSKTYKESLISQIKQFDPNLSRSKLEALNQYELEDLLAKGVEKSLQPTTPRKEDFENSPARMGFGKKTNKPLYDSELMGMLCPYRDFVGVIMRDELKGLLKEMIKKEKERFGFIINTDHSGGKGEHWQAIYVNTDRKDASAEFYDSYGDPPSQDVEEELKKFADNFPWYFKFKVNRIKHQTDKSNKCGYHSANFLIDRFKGRSFKNATEFGGEDRAVDSAKQFRKFGFI